MKIIVATVLRATGLTLLMSQHEVYYCPHITREDLLEQIIEYDAIIARGSCSIDKEVINRGKKLKVIGVPGAGVNHIDMVHARERNIQVLTVPDAIANSVAEFTIGHMINMCRHIGRATFDTKERGIWNKNLYKGRELFNKRLGIIGFGRIGSRVARIAGGISMDVCAYDPYVDAEVFERAQVKRLTLEELLTSSDVVSLHVPLTQETQNMISKPQIELMPRGSYLLNLSRGGVVDEEALADALESKSLAAAVCDVLADEPKPGGELKHSRLLSNKNLIVSPHMSSWTIETQDRAASTVASRVIEALKQI